MIYTDDNQLIIGRYSFICRVRWRQRRWWWWWWWWYFYYMFDQRKAYTFISNRRVVDRFYHRLLNGVALDLWLFNKIAMLKLSLPSHAQRRFLVKQGNDQRYLHQLLHLSASPHYINNEVFARVVAWTLLCVNNSFYLCLFVCVCMFVCLFHISFMQTT